MELKSEVVVFKDKTTLTVTEANWDVSMTLQHLEEQAAKDDQDKLTRQIFHVLIYPKLVACSSGQVPSEQEAWDMPATELNRWYEAANRVNKHWFEKLDDPKTLDEIEKQLKKKGKQRPHLLEAGPAFTPRRRSRKVK